MLSSLPSNSPLVAVPYTDCQRMNESHFSDIAFAPHQSFHTIHAETAQTGSGAPVKMVSPTTSDVDRAKQDMKREEEINRAVKSNNQHIVTGSGAVKSQKKTAVKKPVKKTVKSNSKRPKTKTTGNKRKSTVKKKKKKTNLKKHNKSKGNNKKSRPVKKQKKQKKKKK